MIFNVCVIKVEKTELSGFARNKDMINKFNQNFLNFADKCKYLKNVNSKQFFLNITFLYKMTVGIPMFLFGIFVKLLIENKMKKFEK